MAPHSSTLAWKVPWTEEPGRLQSMGSRRVGHHWATSLSLFTFMRWKSNGNPLQCSCLENPRDGGAWWAAIYGVAQSRTRLKRLSSSSSSQFTGPSGIPRWDRGLYHITRYTCSSDCSHKAWHMVLVTEPKPNWAVAESSGVQSCLCLWSQDPI